MIGIRYLWVVRGTEHLYEILFTYIHTFTFTIQHVEIQIYKMTNG